MQDKDYLLQALSLASLRRGFCAPNPAVGAVVVKNQQVIGEGYHYQAGYPHAEPEALKSLSTEETQGATLYVTLEPCCHHGRTPPCTDLIIQKKMARVIYGYPDPNPSVKGKGAEKLIQAGIQCEYLPLPAITEFYASYQFWHQHHRPFLTAKLALSADGKIAHIDRRPATITNELTNQFTHQQRLHSDALLTSVNTIIQDNPQLNVRLADKIVSKPLYIVDRHLNFPVTARVIQTASHLTLFHQEQINPQRHAELDKLGIKCISISTSADGLLDLTQIVDYIGQEGEHDVWLEGGSKIFSAFIHAHLVQKVFLYHSVKKLGEEAYAANLSPHFFEQFRAEKPFYLGEDKIETFFSLDFISS